MTLRFDQDQALKELTDLQAKLTNVLSQAAAIQPVPTGPTERVKVWSEDNAELYRYGDPSNPPLLIIYSLVNRPYILDLNEQRSMIRALRDAGFCIYLMDWGYPDPCDRFLTLHDYIGGYIRRANSFVSKQHDCKPDMLGVCQGGTMAACFAALYPDAIRKLVLLVTPVDFEAGDSALTRLSRHIDIDSVVDTMGNISAHWLNQFYVSLKPYRLLSQRYIEMAELAGNEAALADFLRMERWMYDSPNQAGEAYRQFAKDFYQENKLIRGETVIGDQTVDLRNIRAPVMNVYAELDHLVPPPSAKALSQCIPKSRYREEPFAGGHLGVFVSGRAQKSLYPAIGEWLSKPAKPQQSRKRAKT